MKKGGTTLYVNAVVDGFPLGDLSFAQEGELEMDDEDEGVLGVLLRGGRKRGVERGFERVDVDVIEVPR